MSSYNNIQKIKYTKTPSDVVALEEYIIFEDTHAKEKYVVFRFLNNVNQRLFEFKFEVIQYNKDNELIEKSTVVHKDFVAEANETFVPAAKLKVNFECHSLEVKLEAAVFDRVIWSDGEFKDNSYRFESYAETVSKQTPAQPSPELKKSKKSKKKNKQRNKAGFDIQNISRRNRAVFPAVFNVFLCAVFVALVVFSTFYFKEVTGAFVIDDFIVKENSTNYVTILSYNGDEADIEIPSQLDSYYVSGISSGAFRNSGVKTVRFLTQKSLVIEANAFKNCSALTTVTGTTSCGKITLMAGAFTDCKALVTFEVPTAVLCAKCFDGTNSVKRLIFNSVVYTDGKLLDIFNGLKSITLDYFYINSVSSLSFMEGVTIR